MRSDEKVNILLVDDQPAKLLSYEVILREIGENLIKASSGREALEHLLKSDIAVVLMDVCMPELDGFELAAMIREHPRFRKTAIIFISAIHLTDVDRLRGYEMGAVDYVPVPVIPEVLRAKVKIFAELYRKSRQLEQLNAELERRVADRTAELERSTRRLQESEERRNLALGGRQDGVVGLGPRARRLRLGRGAEADFRRRPGVVRGDACRACASWSTATTGSMLRRTIKQARQDAGSYQVEFRICRPDGGVRWCLGTAAASKDAANRISRISGVTIDITDRKEAEERQLLLAREVDHRAKNALAVVHAIVSLTRADNIKQFVAAVEGRIQALARAHSLLVGIALARRQHRRARAGGARALSHVRASTASGLPEASLSLEPSTAQALALALHELATNAAKYGALSLPSGGVQVDWELTGGQLELRWTESGGPPVDADRHRAASAFASSRRASKASSAARSSSTGAATGCDAPSRSRIRCGWSFPECRSASAQKSGDARLGPVEVGAAQARSAGRGRKPDRHDDGADAARTRLRRGRPLRHGPRSDRGDRARADRRRHSRHQSRRRDGLSGRPHRCRPARCRSYS